MATVEQAKTKMQKKQEHVEAFFDGWALYRKILQENYMFHQEIYTAVEQQLRTSENAQGTMRLLDLGCGDADYLSRVLRNFQLQAYTGVDLSQVALGEAKQHLADLQMIQAFQQSDLLSYLEHCEQSFDIILASYSLHHLSLAEKKRFFEHCQRILAPAGCLWLIDEFRGEGESRETYLQRWWVYLEQDCPQLSAEEKQFIREHMASSDFPESVSTHADLALSSGFKVYQELYCDPQDLHRFFSYSFV